MKSTRAPQSRVRAAIVAVALAAGVLFAGPAAAGPESSLAVDPAVRVPFLDWADMAVPIVKDGSTIYTVSSIGSDYWQRYGGPTLDTMTQLPDANHSAFGNVHPGGDYYWMGDIWRDPADGAWYGVVHAEYNFGVDHSRRLLLGKSTDKGATWSNLGDILTPDVNYTPPVPGALDIGGGDQRLVVDNANGYFYIFYIGGYVVPGSPSVVHPHISVARSPISAKMAPGTWTKWYNGSFSQPALGGHDGIVMPFTEGDDYNYRDVPLFSYSSYLGKFIAMGHNWIATADNMATQNWSGPQPLAGGLASSQCNYLWGVNPDTGDKYTLGQTFRFYGAGINCGHIATYQNVTMGVNPLSVSNWSADNGFSQNPWRYDYTTDNGASFHPMTLNNGTGQWVGSEPFCTVINGTQQHPGSAGCQSVRAWQAPYSGTFTVSAAGPVSVAPGCIGNTAGVNIRIVKNTTQIWPASGWQNVPNGGSYSFPSFTTSVAAGDNLRFIVDKSGPNNYCDSTTWNQVVTAPRGDPSTGVTWPAGNWFGQGWDQWRYEYSPDHGATFLPMTRDAASGRWTGSESACAVIDALQQHPGGGLCEAARVWRAPYTMSVTIGANLPISVAPGCGGNDAGVGIRVLKNETQIWPASGTHVVPNGTSYTFPSGVTTTVNAGDRLRFVTSLAGSTNYCDSTIWDPRITKN